MGTIGAKSTDAINFKNKPCEEADMSFEFMAVSELTGVEVRGSVKRILQNQ